MHWQVGVHKIRQMAQTAQAIPVQAKNRDRTEGHGAPENLGTGNVRNSPQMMQGLAVELPHSGDVVIFGEGHEHGIFTAGFLPFNSMHSFVRLKQITENFRGMPKIGMSPSPKKIIRHEYEKNRVSL